MRPKRIVVSDLMQTDYAYFLTEPVGKTFIPTSRRNSRRPRCSNWASSAENI